MERSDDWRTWLEDIEEENFYELVHRFVSSNFAILFKERHQTLEVLDPRLVDISPLDREGFREELRLLGRDERDRMLHELGGVSVIVAADLVAECWDQYVTGADDREYEYRFNRAVLDHYCAVTKGQGQQTTLVDGSPCGVVQYGDWDGKMSALVLSRWDSIEAGWLQHLAGEMDLARFSTIVAVTRELPSSGVVVPTARCRVVSLAEICLNEAVRVFDSCGVTWLYSPGRQMSSTVNSATTIGRP